ncbi:hypothetical protein [Aureimonas sp. SK2]|uniref:hypothetical protein n=1 Tax=Aureimonas sp. SK2 TaxID=3015992 RepID=UPI002444C644|nr:hypothetical protein [Aureimonas sp. SK2]
MRFVLAPSALDLVRDLAADPAALHRARSELFLPHNVVWIEWQTPEGPAGVLIDTRPMLDVDMPAFMREHQVLGRQGSGVLVCRIPERTDGTLSFAFRSMLFSTVASDAELNDAAAIPFVPPQRPTFGTPEDLQAMLFAFCAAVGTPRLTEREPAELGKLNAARARKGKPWLLPYSTLRLTKTAAAAHADTRPSQTSPDGRRVSWHKVRAFMRIRRANVEFVRPHTRGSRDVGVKTHVRVTAGPAFVQNPAV